MPWEYTANGVLGFILLLLPCFALFVSTWCLGIATANESKNRTDKLVIAWLMILISFMMLVILVPNELSWLLEK